MFQKAVKPVNKNKTNTTDSNNEASNGNTSQKAVIDSDSLSIMLKTMSAPLQDEKQNFVRSQTSPTQMPDKVQAKMEGAFSTDFSQVNIFKDDVSVSQIGALAYTQGNNVHFAPGKYEPETKDGQDLLGHELTHVEQQRNGKVKSMPKLADIKQSKKSNEIISKEQQRNETWGAKYNSPKEQMQLKLKYGLTQLKSNIAQKKYKQFKSNSIAQLKRDRMHTRFFRSKIKQFENKLTQKKIAYGSNDFIQLAAEYFPDQDFSTGSQDFFLSTTINDSPSLEKEADIMGKRAADGRNAKINSKSSDIQKKEDKALGATLGGGKQYGFLHDEFKWRMDGRTSFISAANKLRRKYGIGLSFAEDKDFGVELIRNNQLSGTYEDIPAKDTIINIPKNEILPNTMYSSSGFSVNELTIKESDAKGAMSDMIAARSSNTLAASDKRDLQNIEGITNNFRAIINNKSLDLEELYVASNKAGRRLWTYCATNVDVINSVDMLLYVGRNLMRSYIKESKHPKLVKDKRQLPHLIYQLEQGSRNLDQYIPDEANTYVVLLAGFDPFDVSLAPSFVLNNSNTASFFALKYNEKTFEVNGKKVKFHTQIFPVRGNDFEEGIVEGFYENHLSNVDMVINTGIGNRAFEIEGRAQNIYDTSATDNNDDVRSGSGKINDSKSSNNTYANSLISRSEFDSSPVLSGQSDIDYDDAGSGATAGDFYCNEIFYRVSELADKMGVTIPNGFIHLPFSAFTDITKRANLTGRFHQILMEILKLKV
jgi:pyrrolidone-carboxylate peptidase